MSEFVVAGLLITPLVKAALIALLIYVPLRFLLAQFSLAKIFWHPLLAEAGLYVCIVAVVNFALP